MYKSIQLARFLLYVSIQKSDEVTEEALWCFLQRGDSREETVGSNLLTLTQKQYFPAISNAQMLLYSI